VPSSRVPSWPLASWQRSMEESRRSNQLRAISALPFDLKTGMIARLRQCSKHLAAILPCRHRKPAPATASWPGSTLAERDGSTGERATGVSDLPSLDRSQFVFLLNSRRRPGSRRRVTFAILLPYAGHHRNNTSFFCSPEPLYSDSRKIYKILTG
jgi:hypothetical protein